jgi:hypothetical protein
MTSAIDQQMLSCFLQLNETEKKSVLLLLQTFLKGKTSTNDKAFIEQYNKEIDEALAEIESGDYITQAELEKQAAKW